MRGKCWKIPKFRFYGILSSTGRPLPIILEGPVAEAVDEAERLMWIDNSRVFSAALHSLHMYMRKRVKVGVAWRLRARDEPNLTPTLTRHATGCRTHPFKFRLGSDSIWTFSHIREDCS
jgi:hypothetical protein